MAIKFSRLSERGKASYRALQKRCRKARQNRARTFVDEHKASHGCLRCGERDPVVLDCHHRVGTQKECEISKMVARGAHWFEIQHELAKCDILCANCHRREHKRHRDAGPPHEQVSLPLGVAS